MGFLAPWFLLGAAALGLPVWLHLLRRHRSNPVPFSSLMFFERRTQSSIKHRRLRYLLLFALRMAVLALVVLAFSEPYLRSNAAAVPGGGLLVLAIDNSFSMRAGDRLTRAKRDAAAALRNGRRAQVIAFASEAHVLTQPIRDAGALRAAIESIEPTDSRSSYGELVRVLRLLPRESLDVHLFSDLQKSSLPPAFADLRLPPGARLTVHPAPGGAPPNWAVESVSAPPRVYDAKPVAVSVTVTGYNAPSAARRLSLVLGGRVGEAKDLTVPANGRATVEFAVAAVPHGLNRAEVRMQPADALPDDDRFLFSIERADPRPVLFVHEPGSRDLLYFRAALEASGRAAFRLEEAQPGQLAALDLSRFAFVVLSDVAGAPEENLKKYVNSGGAVWIALGPRSRRLPLLPAAALQDHLFSRDFQAVSYTDPAHPSIGHAAGWQGVRFYQAVAADIPEARIAARLGDGTPVLSETTLGHGRVLVFGSTFDNISNDFPLHASFVPFVAETAAYLGGADTGLSSYTAGSFLELRSPRERGGAVEVLDPAGRRALSLKEAATASSLALERAGFYEVHRNNGRPELAAVNADRRESDLTPLDSATLALWQHTAAPLQPVPAGGETAPRRPLWPFLLALAIAAAGAESLLANRYLRAPEVREIHKEAAA